MTTQTVFAPSSIFNPHEERAKTALMRDIIDNAVMASGPTLIKDAMAESYEAAAERFADIFIGGNDPCDDWFLSAKLQLVGASIAYRGFGARGGML